MLAKVVVLVAVTVTTAAVLGMAVYWVTVKVFVTELKRISDTRTGVLDLLYSHGRCWGYGLVSGRDDSDWG